MTVELAYNNAKNVKDINIIYRNVCKTISLYLELHFEYVCLYV